MKPLILLGPPGAGKGTQAQLLSHELSVPHISTGDMLRETAQKKTAVGVNAKSWMDTGRLVPDGVVCEIAAERLAAEDARKGFVLDGFPRTLHQAEFLEDLLGRGGRSQPLVLNLRVPPETIIKRLAGRRTCPLCGRIYNLSFQPPRRDLVCDMDGTALVERTDDGEGAVRQRLLAYELETGPLTDYYRKKNMLREIDGDGDRETVARRLRKAVESS